MVSSAVTAEKESRPRGCRGGSGREPKERTCTTGGKRKTWGVTEDGGGIAEGDIKWEREKWDAVITPERTGVDHD